MKHLTKWTWPVSLATLTSFTCLHEGMLSHSLMCSPPNPSPPQLWRKPNVHTDLGRTWNLSASLLGHRRVKRDSLQDCRVARVAWWQPKAATGCGSSVWSSVWGSSSLALPSYLHSYNTWFSHTSFGSWTLVQNQRETAQFGGQCWDIQSQI